MPYQKYCNYINCVSLGKNNVFMMMCDVITYVVVLSNLVKLSPETFR